ncbi:MAG: type II secretion system protein [Peptococcaceae bacterium]|nr:type II secretion system protein [Peptococcaceae bacterium]
MKRQRAFTLLELICVLVTTGILLTLLSHSLVNGLGWLQAGAQERILADQLEQALDTMEQDIRQAKDIDVDYWERQNALGQTSTSTLRLIMSNTVQEGLLIYRTENSNSTIVNENPTERPKTPKTLYRTLTDSSHSGASQPVCIYLNSDWDTPKGMQIHYYNRAGAPCSLEEPVYSVRVVLSGTTKQGAVVSRERRVPLAMKQE